MYTLLWRPEERSKKLLTAKRSNSYPYSLHLILLTYHSLDIAANEEKSGNCAAPLLS